mmetsp:Transcript_47800/g.76110  ORF Transcript_47800/g.76110 Transcript_47800/m.76110 type:complete len:207 (-) Transcript_47800:10-630(-)
MGSTKGVGTLPLDAQFADAVLVIHGTLGSHIRNVHIRLWFHWCGHDGLRLLKDGNVWDHRHHWHQDGHLHNKGLLNRWSRERSCCSDRDRTTCFIVGFHHFETFHSIAKLLTGEHGAQFLVQTLPHATLQCAVGRFQTGLCGIGQNLLHQGGTDGLAGWSLLCGCPWSSLQAHCDCESRVEIGGQTPRTAREAIRGRFEPLDVLSH